jgi:glutamine synthetase
MGLSKVGRHFIAGLLRHAPEITAVTNQLVNSYKRLVEGTGTGSQTVFEAPVFVSWGRFNSPPAAEQSWLLTVTRTRVSWQRDSVLHRQGFEFAAEWG